MKFSCLVFLAVIIINITDKFLMKETGNVIEKSEILVIFMKKRWTYKKICYIMDENTAEIRKKCLNY